MTGAQSRPFAVLRTGRHLRVRCISRFMSTRLNSAPVHELNRTSTAKGSEGTSWMAKKQWTFFKKTMVGFVVVIGLGFIAPLTYSKFEPATWFYDVIGADVSHHQGLINWVELQQSDIAFVYMKATEGGDFQDPMFQENWQGSAQVNLPRGAYHFFTQCRSGEEQARNFIQTVPLDPTALPHVLDAEHLGPCQLGPAVADVSGEIKVFIDMVGKHYGRRPLIYTTHQFHKAYLEKTLSGEKYWLRSLVWPPIFGPDQWTLWQFHNYGRRPGVNGPLDLNAFAGTADEFEAFVGYSPRLVLSE